MPVGIHHILIGGEGKRRLELEDEWILSRLSGCAGKVNAAMEAHNFAEATNAIFSFWLYDFCDYYLELVKPRMRLEVGHPSGVVAKEVLYICLDRGLRLLHPMMPFVTEELYQRLPQSMSKFESICVADYPENVLGWSNSRVEEQMETLKVVIGAVRSQMAQIGIKNSARPNAMAYFVVEDEQKLVKANVHHVVTLAKLESFAVLLTPKPEEDGRSLVQSVVSDKCSVFIDATGLVDFKVEIEKLMKKRGLVAKSLESLEKKKSMAGYETKVPADVRADNQEKADSLSHQLREIDAAAEILKKAGGL